MKIRIAIIATAVIIVASLVVGSTLAFFTDKGEVNNVITIGKVNITLTEPKFQNLTHNTYKVDGVTPNEVITKDPTITNVGDHDAYIRCKVSVTGLNDTQMQQLINGIAFNEGWVKSGDYYYFKDVLPKKPATGESTAKLFDTVTIPSAWDNSIVGKEFAIHITAEAIQEDNFKPTRDSNQNITAWQYSNNGGNVSVLTTSSTTSS